MSVWEDWKADFRHGYCEAERDAEDQGAMFDQPGDAVERERQYFWTRGVPARRPTADESKLRALVELCNEQAETIALQAESLSQWDGYAARLDEYVSAVSDRDRQIAALGARLKEYAAAVAERDAEMRPLADKLARAEQWRDTYQANGKRINAEVRLLLEFPGAIEALQKAVHPDTGKGGDVHSRTEVFKTLNAVRDRLGLNKRKR